TLIGLVHRLADIGHIKAIGHDDTDLDAFLAVEAEFPLERLFQPEGHRGDIAEPEDLVSGTETEFAHVVGRGHATFDGSAHGALRRRDAACRIDRILPGQRLANTIERQATPGKYL